MKHLLRHLPRLALCAALAVGLQAQVKTVSKTISTNALLEGFTVPSGQTITFASGSAITLPDNALAIADVSGLQPALANQQIYQIKRWWNALFLNRANLYVFGDSVGYMKPRPHYERLIRAYGFGGYMGRDASFTGIDVFTGTADYFSGTIAENDPSFVIWPTGRYYRLPASSTIQRGSYAPGYTATKLKVIYHAEAGAGHVRPVLRAARRRSDPGGDVRGHREEPDRAT
jgi:hypothetical protein